MMTAFSGMDRIRRWLPRTWGLCMLVLLVFALRESQRMGDGCEYLMYAHALASHYSPDILSTDFEYAKQLDGCAYLNVDYARLGAGDAVGHGVQTDGLGFLKVANGSVYSVHFWLYPLFIAPLLAAFSAAGASPHGAFALGNWLFVLGALAYLWRYWQGTQLQKHVLTALFLCSGTTYYIWWTHPEVYTASLVLIALMALADKRYGVAALSAGLAAAHNPPVAFILFVFLGIAVWGGRDAKGDAANATLPSGRRKILCSAAVGLMFALMPVLFFYLTLGVSNPIVAAGGTDTSLMGLNRLWSLVFDLNLGMVAGMPGTFLVLLVLVAHTVWAGQTHHWEAVLRRLLPLLFGCALMVAMALPATATTNWNSGQTVMSRYAYWLAVPLMFGCVVALGKSPGRLLRATVLLAILVQLLSVAYYGIWGKNWRGGNYLGFKPMARLILDRFPRAYNPVPEIFIERLMGREGIPSPDTKIHVFAYPSSKAATKLVVPVRAGDIYLHAMQKACESASKSAVQEGWVYINATVTHGCGLDLRTEYELQLGEVQS